MIYLDNSATTLIKPEGVVKAMSGAFGNAGRGGHQLSLSSAKRIYACREEIAELFEASMPEHVIFTKNGTEALNLVILGSLEKDNHVVCTSMDHNAVIRPLTESGVDFTIANADECGFVHADSIKEALRPYTKLLILTHASNVCGTLQRIANLTEIAHQNGTEVLVDAAQSAGIIPFSMKKDGIDYLAFSGHKGLMGPQGTGVLILGKGKMPRPLQFGGTGSASEDTHQPLFLPDRYESGTLNSSGIAGLLESVRYIKKVGLKEICEKKTFFVNRLLEGLLNIDGVRVYGPSDAEKRADAVAFNIEGWDCNALGTVLEEEYEIYGRSGLHCAPLAHCTVGSFECGGSMRLSPSYFTTLNEIDRALWCINRIAKRG